MKNLPQPAFFLTLLMVAFLSSCGSPLGQDPSGHAISSVVPVISFNSSIGSRSILPSTMSNAEATFFFFCPALTGFTTRQGGVEEGESIAPQDFLNTSISFTARSFSDGVNGISSGVRFQGEFDDGSGSIVIEIDSDNTKFWYEQLVFVADPNKKVDVNKAQKSVIHQTISGTMDSSDLSLLGESSFGYYTISSDDTKILMVAPKSEFYSGPWSAGSPGQTGAGLVILQLAPSFAPATQYGAVSQPTDSYATFGHSSLAESLAYIEAFAATNPVHYSMPTLIYKTSTDSSATKLQGALWAGVNSAATAKANLPSSTWNSKSLLDTYPY